MMIRSFAVGLFLIPTLSLAAPCAAPVFTPPGGVQPNGDTLLIVTHPSTLWDTRFASKAGMDAAVTYAKKKNIPVVYMMDNQSQTYFFADCNPTYWYHSVGGEFEFPVKATHVITVGGHWESCQQTTMMQLMDSWKIINAGKNLKITTALDGVYSAGLYLENFSSTVKADFDRFIQIITYGNDRNADGNMHKLTLLESFGIIQNKSQQIEFLKLNLPPYLSLGRNYRVELQREGRVVEVLQNGKAGGPVLILDYVNSLWDGKDIPAIH